MIETPDYGIFESIDELRSAIEMGLDIEFFLYGVRYNISWRDYKPFICTCPDGDAVFFENTDDLLDGYKINGRSLRELWKDIEVYSM